MSKDSQFHECNACNKMFKKSDDLERHIAAKHDEKQCTYCDKMCSSEQDLTEHYLECVDIGVANCICNKCNETFTHQGLKRHKPKCQSGKKFIECHQCGEMVNGTDKLKKQKEREHTREALRSKEICYHWKRGNCFKGNTCLFSHAGFQNKEAQENQP